VEELLLRAVLAGEELDVVDQQRLDLLELALELVHRLVLQRLHHRAEELLRAQVEHAHAGIGRAHGVAGGNIRWVLPRPVPPYSSSGLWARSPGFCAACRAAARPSITDCP